MAGEAPPTRAEIDRHIAGDVDPVRDHLLARAVAAEAERDRLAGRVLKLESLGAVVAVADPLRVECEALRRELAIVLSLRDALWQRVAEAEDERDEWHATASRVSDDLADALATITELLGRSPKPTPELVTLRETERDALRARLEALAERWSTPPQAWPLVSDEANVAVQACARELRAALADDAAGGAPDAEAR